MPMSDRQGALSLRTPLLAVMVFGAGRASLSVRSAPGYRNSWMPTPPEEWSSIGE